MFFFFTNKRNSIGFEFSQGEQKVIEKLDYKSTMKKQVSQKLPLQKLEVVQKKEVGNLIEGEGGHSGNSLFKKLFTRGRS